MSVKLSTVLITLATLFVAAALYVTVVQKSLCAALGSFRTGNSLTGQHNSKCGLPPCVGTDEAPHQAANVQTVQLSMMIPAH